MSQKYKEPAALTFLTITLICTFPLPNFHENSKFDYTAPICILLKFDSASLLFLTYVFQKLSKKTFGGGGGSA